MDKLDKFNNIILDLSLNWKYIFYFVAGIYVLSTIIYIAIDSRWGLAIISWAILVVVAIAMTIVLKEKEKSPKKSDEVSEF